jgi:hypothetical protein
MGIEEVLIAPRSLWQNPYVERVIGSIRRDMLEHVIVLHEPHLRRLLTGYLTYTPAFAPIWRATWTVQHSMLSSHPRQAMCGRSPQ